MEDAQGEITLGLNGVTDDDSYQTSVVGYGINDNRVDFNFNGDIISGTFYQVKKDYKSVLLQAARLKILRHWATPVRGGGTLL